SAGVSATSQKSAGVSAVSGANSGILAISGSQGPSIPNPNLPSIAGVIGSSDAQPGVIGTSRAQVGVYGFSSAGVGLVGHSTNAASYAGIFFGNFVVVGGTKSAAVPFPNPAHALLRREPGALVRGFRQCEAQARSRRRQFRCGFRQSDQARRLSRVRDARRRLPRALRLPQA